MESKFIVKKEMCLKVLHIAGCTVISSDLQVKHGTTVIQLPKKTHFDRHPTFAIYKSGYIRCLVGHNSENIYQINPRPEVDALRFHYNTLDRVAYKEKACIKIHGEDAQFTYLCSYIFRNYDKYLWSNH